MVNDKHFLCTHEPLTTDIVYTLAGITILIAAKATGSSGRTSVVGIEWNDCCGFFGSKDIRSPEFILYPESIAFPRVQEHYIM